MEPVLELLLDWLNKGLKLLVLPNFSQLDHIQWLLKEELTLLLEISLKMIGDGMHMILLKEVTGLVIKMPFITCAEKHLKPCLNWNLTECLFQEPLKEKFTKELLEVNL